ncbi:MAG: hypothetical protein GX354_11310 [Firmicutes bacterium]|nr:hypothetical protein [Bacillota bacterium]
MIWLFKDDWEAACQRLEAWWEGELIDRCVVLVTAPRDEAARRKKPKPHGDIREWWLDVEYRINEAEAEFRSTFYGGEAFPIFFPNLGPGIAAAYMGVQPVFAEETVWFDQAPIIDNWEDRQPITLDEDNQWWQVTKELTQGSLARSENRWITAITDLGGGLDLVASLRGIKSLLMDLIDHPDAVKQLSEEIQHVWFRCFDELNRMIHQSMVATSSWMPIWCKGTWYPLQCDCSAMISPGMFEEFVLPGLQEQCRQLDYSIYHWDGPGQIPHLDLLLSIPELTGIQWTPGDGNPRVDSPKWYPLYKRIQDAGKNLVLLDTPPRGIERLLKELSPKGLLIQTHVDSEEEARSLLKEVGRSFRD